jgi:hypothetical protein
MGFFISLMAHLLAAPVVVIDSNSMTGISKRFARD